MIAQSAQSLTTLYRFNGTDGAAPYGALVQATNGDLYGTTACCGLNGASAGTIFKVSQSGALTTLYNFCAQSGCSDGVDPAAALVQATNGDLYGTSPAGGANNAGTIFKINLGGTLTTIYNFTGGADGSIPRAVLVQGTNGDLYGTTSGGSGTAFKMTPGGTLTTLYNFCSQSACADGGGPNGIIQATNGDFYGTTLYGGANSNGTVFEMTPGGALTTLYSFCSQITTLGYCADGGGPNGIIQATKGDFYSTTQTGGTNNGGTVFKITPTGTLTTLYSFCSQADCADGTYLVAALVQATDGNFYGTTYYGGANVGFMSPGAGTLFKITPSGTLTTLYNFCSQSGCTDGANPWAGLLQATNGEFYGTTVYCGTACTGDGWGTIFRLSVGLGAFVETPTASGKVGAKVTVLGNRLTGATSVTFNGTAAAFTVNSTGTAVSTTVPVGATTGTIKVVASTGNILSSNVPFRVLP